MEKLLLENDWKHRKITSLSEHTKSNKSGEGMIWVILSDGVALRGGQNYDIMGTVLEA